VETIVVSPVLHTKEDAIAEEQDSLLARIISATKKAYMDRGPDFTMEALAKGLGISKKTLYAAVPDKESLLELIIDGARASIKAGQAAAIADPSMAPVDRIRAVLGTLPEDAASFDYLRLAELESSHPRLFSRIQRLMEEDWEATLALFEEGRRSGGLRDFDTAVFREMYTATLNSMFRSRFLWKRGLSYAAALREVVDILMKGIEA